MNAQIEEIAKIVYDKTSLSYLRCVGIAQILYQNDYRKQNEGVWIYNPDGIDWGLGAWQCSLCGCNNHNLPQDKGTNPLIWAGGKYCPNCGAKMKGGAD